jgi:transcriptional regulator with GAF, ATPase, and Fis domain
MFEHADLGTLFLDEVGELPLSVQPKLLRAVEYGEVQRVGSLDTRRVDVRVIAATNRDLRPHSSNGSFRSDLYFRLSVMELHLPPLRDRRDDIPLLTAAFLKECASRLNRPLTGMTTSAERALQRWHWPGNIRELRNVIERACLLSEAKILGEREVVKAMSSVGAPPADVSVPAEASGCGDYRLSSAQRAQIDFVLKQVGGNKTEAARVLGISRRSLYRWIDRLHLSA